MYFLRATCGGRTRTPAPVRRVQLPLELSTGPSPGGQTERQVDERDVGPPAPAGTFTNRNFSADRCHADIDFTCPTPDNAGSVRFVGAFAQQSDTLVSGSGTFTVNDPGVGACLGTYDITLTKI
jgi:hypothetical protein